MITSAFNGGAGNFTQLITRGVFPVVKQLGNFPYQEKTGEL